MSDHWRSLAEDIGAEITEPEKQPEQPEEQTGGPAPTPPPKPARAPRKTTPKKPKNHWQRIAGALGVSFEESEPDEESVDIEETIEAELTEQEPTASEMELQGPTATETSQSDDAAATAERFDAESESMFGIDSEFSDFVADVEEAPQVAEQAEQTEADAETGPESFPFPVSEDEQQPQEPAYDPDHAKRELAALFADPVETNGADIGFSQNTITPSDERTLSTDEFDEPAGRDVEGEFGEEEDQTADVRRPRRRRGGRRRRRKDDQPTAASSEADVSTDLDEESSLDSPADDDSDVSWSKEDAIAADEGRARRGHRKIPSWQDAVGTIVDKNMESRRNNPSSGGNQGGRRRRGSGRGRRRPPQQS